MQIIQLHLYTSITLHEYYLNNTNKFQISYNLTVRIIDHQFCTPECQSLHGYPVRFVVDHSALHGVSKRHFAPLLQVGRAQVTYCDHPRRFPQHKIIFRNAQQPIMTHVFLGMVAGKLSVHDARVGAVTLH